MSFEVGSVVAHIKADVTDFKQGISSAKNEVSGFSGMLGDLGGVLKVALIAGTAAAAAGVVFLGKSALDAAANFEQTKIAFETMLGSASKAQKLLADLQDFAKKTPFNLVELQEGTKKLLAYGVEGDKIIETMRTLGNITSAVGRDKMPQLILAFGQVKAVGHLTGMELRQFSETGVPLLQLLADQFKVSTAEMQDMISKGSVGFPAVQQALNSLGGEGGKWGDMMDKQSKTLSGSLSNLQDTWNQLLVVLGTVFIPIATQVVQAITGFLSPLQDLVKGTTSVGDVFHLTGEQTKFLQGIMNEFKSFLFDTLVPAVQAVVNFMVTFWKTHQLEFSAAWQIIWGVIQVLWGLIYGLLKVGLELLAGDWKGAWQAIHQMTETVWNGLKDIFSGALTFITKWGGQIFDYLTKPFRDAWDTISSLITKIKDGLDFTKRHSPSVVDIVKKGVYEVNRAMEGLDMAVNMKPAMTGAVATSNMSSSMMNSIHIDLGGAVISDSLGAQRIGEMVGDSIIRKLQATVRF